MAAIIQVLFILAISTNVALAIKCLECSDMPDPQDCTTVTECSAYETCHVTQFITTGGLVLYNSGCIAKNRCTTKRRNVEDVLQKRQDMVSPLDILTCVACCDTEFCNLEGCGITGLRMPQRGPVCFSCAAADDPKKCRDVMTCSDTQVCSLYQHYVGPDLVYTSKCDEKRRCISFSGKRGLFERSNFCFKCCTDDFCNQDCGPSAHLTTPTPSPTTTVVTKPSTHKAATTKQTTHKVVTTKQTTHKQAATISTTHKVATTKSPVQNTTTTRPPATHKVATTKPPGHKHTTSKSQATHKATSTKSTAPTTRTTTTKPATHKLATTKQTTHKATTAKPVTHKATKPSTHKPATTKQTTHKATTTKPVTHKATTTKLSTHKPVATKATTLKPTTTMSTTSKPTTTKSTTPKPTPTTTVLPLTTKDPETSCKKQNYIYDSHLNLCMKFHTNPRLNWTEALHECEKDNGTLAVITSDAKAKDVQDFISSHSSNQRIAYWVGANDQTQAHVFTWLNGETTVLQGNKTIDLTQASCLYIDGPTKADLNFESCKEKHAYICEKKNQIKTRSAPLQLLPI